MPSIGLRNWSTFTALVGETKSNGWLISTSQAASIKGLYTTSAHISAGWYVCLTCTAACTLDKEEVLNE